MAGIKKDLYIDPENLKWLEGKKQSLSKTVNYLIFEARIREEINPQK